MIIMETEKTSPTYDPCEIWVERKKKQSSMEMIIVHGTINFYGGVATVIEQLVQHQLSNGYTVVIMYPSNQSALINSSTVIAQNDVIKMPVRDRSVPGGNLICGLPIKRVYQILKKHDNTKRIVFHMHNPASVGMCNIGIRHVPVVCTLHGIDIKNTSSVFYSTVYKVLLNKPMLLTAVSDNTNKFYSKYTDKEIVTIPNGLVEHNSCNNRDRANRCFKRIGFIGELDDLKGWRYLLEAYKILTSDEQAKIHLVFAGKGSDSQIEVLYNEIKSHKLKNVDYLGVVPRAGDVLIPNLDLVVLPSQSEGTPMVLIEAISNGVPILASKVGGIPEVLDDGINGFFITRDKEDIAQKIRMIFRDDKLYKAMTSNCRSKFNAKFNMSKIGKVYADLYLNAIEVKS